jgi:ATP-binding cassette, subfamily B, multidrug efflux pump
MKGQVDFKEVSFGYEADQPTLSHLNLRVKPGETVAIVGPTGAGKSTIIHLISRFYNINAGDLLIDNRPIKSITLESLRKQMGIMQQDTFIFSASVFDNIRYGKLDATEEEVIAAAKAVCAHEFISKMEEGYHTQVHENGSRLSVGQRQLIGLARIFLADPKIIILDEATSSIDTETEREIQKGLAVLFHGRTTFVIAHRLSTIRTADRILYLENGRILEDGTHQELIEKNGHYHRLYTTQMKYLGA